jgi:DNA polymerase III subunit gamma/tau
MSSYLALARKYRPQNFAELFGQEVLVKTLQNAIRNNRLHHAYILNGIRGVGKTTSARIIAKTINCLDENSLKNATACGFCDNCRLIASSKHQDVIEIDAASRTGVDDIREIIDSIAYAPVLAKYKIYIIDEVHMLSNNAFNALLKTLEEPPAHVKFIFATTEIKKLPITVLSRCQRFDLRRLRFI